jgi:hypothetical protein
MARRKHDNETNDDGVQDSFLDIVANIVGILILLVIVVGIRAGLQPRSPTNDSEQSPPALISPAVLAAKTEGLTRLEADVARMTNALASLREEAEQRDLERLDLAAYVVAVEQQLETERAKLSESEAERLRIRSALAQADQEWQQLMLQKVALASDAGQPQKLVHTPTPIVRNHSEQTLHLRLERGRVAVVPFERLVKLIDSRPLDSHRRDLERQGGIGRLGPVDGFELRYALIARASDPGPGGARQLVTFMAGELRPVRPDVGEPVDEAMAGGSSLDTLLRSTNPRDAIVMVWVYPDSTSEFRDLQAAIRERGYAVDLRLLPEDAHISFSPEGRKTSAQ